MRAGIELAPELDDEHVRIVALCALLLDQSGCESARSLPPRRHRLGRPPCRFRRPSVASGRPPQQAPHSATSTETPISAGTAVTLRVVTPREKLHRIVDELSEAEVEATLTRLEREREALERWADRRP